MNRKFIFIFMNIYLSLFFSVNLWSQEYSVKNFGATGNGITDDTIAIQKALDSLQPGDTLYFPSGTYLRGKIYINNKSNLSIYGNHSTHKLAGVNASIIFKGECNNITIDGLNIIGDGLVSSNQRGISNSSGQDLKDLKIINNIIKNVTIGISVNADLSGSIENVLIDKNHIENVVGTKSGNGYGIHFAHGNRLINSRVVISHNTIISAQRHSIYIAKGSGAEVSDNTIKNHRNGVAIGSPRAAIFVARTINVKVLRNTIQDYTDGAIMVSNSYDPAKKDITGDVIISDNIISGSKNLMAIQIGYLKPQYSYPSNVTVNNNTISDFSVHVAPIQIYGGKNIIFENNHIHVKNSDKLNSIFKLKAFEESGIILDTLDKIKLNNNNIYIDSQKQSQRIKIINTDNNVPCTNNNNDNYKGNSVNYFIIPDNGSKETKLPVQNSFTGDCELKKPIIFNYL